MSKIKLSKQELAALDLLIASIEHDSGYSTGDASAAFITAIAKVATAVTKTVIKVTPAVTQVTPVVTEVTAAGADARSHRADLSKVIDANGNLSLKTLIELRNQAS